MTRQNSVLILSAFVSLSLSAPAEDEVKDLPGLSTKPNFRQYSGYLKAGGPRRLHYWFVESSGNPKTDPVVLWMNGGPGCSSMHGFLTEHGPFQIQPDGKTLEMNPFAWNAVANMIYLEAPAGVGFSYSQDHDYKTDDDKVAKDNHLALQDFFSKFPEYKENDFYITGESYGGIYVPTLSSVVLKDPEIKLKGFVVGNGLSSNSKNDNSIVYFAYYHGLIGDVAWNELLNACCPNQTSERCNFTAGTSRPQCESKLSEIQVLVWASGLNVYNLYSECAGGVRDLNLHRTGPSTYVTSHFGWPFASLTRTKFVSQKLKELKSTGLFKVSLSPPCTNETAASDYLNSEAVRKAIHIPKDVQKWEICSGTVSMGYRRLYNTMKPQYEEAMEKRLKIMVYNGDVDMACNFLGDEWFVDDLHAKYPQKRKQWFYKAADETKQVAGYVKQFDRVTFVTIRGAGHMVPTDKPRPALEMFVNFIQNKPF